MKYRAQFRQPRKHLNPLNVTFRAPITVELFHVGSRPKRWRAQIEGGKILTYEGGGAIDVPEASGGAANVKAQVQQLFAEQITPWEEILTPEEQHERDHPTPEINKKRISGPRDNYGMKGHK